MVFDFDVHYRIRWEYSDSRQVCDMLLRWNDDPFEEESKDDMRDAIVRVAQNHCFISGRAIPQSVFDDIVADVRDVWIEEKYGEKVG